MFTNQEHTLCSLNCIVTHLHDACFNCIAMGYLEVWRGMMRIHQQVSKLWILNRIKWLVCGDDPLCQHFFELFLIPRTLWNISLIVNWQNKGLTAAALTCFSNALWMVVLVDSSFCRNWESAAGSRIFFPEATVISSAVI